MTVRLRRSSQEFAEMLIRAGKVAFDDRDAWSEHQPSTQAENAFIAEHGWPEYAKWHLAIDDEEPPETKAHYKFPYGDFRVAHRCAILAAESRAGQRKYFDVQNAAAHLHGMIEAAAMSIPGRET
ncbi:MAG TPA: hypothetical protein VGQ62_05785 [Chloroflexota bacterium]|jgi:hypothetical protein|nr:hypothetical protein [Chloroflexota bacterium]